MTDMFFFLSMYFPKNKVTLSPPNWCRQRTLIFGVWHMDYIKSLGRSHRSYLIESKGTVRINQGGGPVTLKKSGFRNMMTPINVSSFFYDPLKLEDQKAVTLP